jgi:hypothetical protein
MKKEVFKLYEDFHTYWNTWEIRLRTAKWLHNKIGAIVPGEIDLENEEWGPISRCSPESVGPKLKTCSKVDKLFEECLQVAEAEVDSTNKAAPLCKCLHQTPSMRKCMNSCWKPGLQLLRCSTNPAAAGESSLRVDANGKVSLSSKTAQSPQHGEEKDDAATLKGARAASIEWYNWSPVSDYPKSAFAGGRVDLNIVNHLDAPVQLLVHKTFETGAVPQNQGVLLPGEGVRFISHERERWVVKDRAKNKVLREWQVDIAHGIVQDIVVQ